MAKRKAARRATPAKSARKGSAARPARRKTVKRTAKAKATARKPQKAAKKAGGSSRAKPAVKKQPALRSKSKTAAKAGPSSNSSSAMPGKVPRLDRVRRTLDEGETRRTPPSSLDMDRRGSAVRTGRAESAENVREHHGMDGVTGGDPDVDIEDAYFTGEEAPGGDNPTPDQDVVEDIGKALGVTYDDSEELKGANKLEERDKHRWELDPASAEDYRDHDKDE
jgi:hypothetical protein